VGVSNPCDRKNWLASASESSLMMSPSQLYNPPIQAVDGMAGTRWSSGAAQKGGEWFELDLGGVAAHLSQLVLDTSLSASDFPASYELGISSDDATFKVVASGSGSGTTTINFTDQPGRYLKVTQKGTSTSWWSIQEVTVVCTAK